jgi:hypothetical protein
MLKHKFKAKKPALIGYILLLAIGLFLTAVRWYSGINHNFVFINNEITSHISNFALSILFYLVIGYLWLLMGMNLRILTARGAGLIVANVVCETVMTFLNTPDLIDAVYGIVGVLVAYAYLAITKKIGLEEITE